MARGGSFLDKLLFGYRTIQWNGNILPPETTVNFIGSGPVVDNPSMGRTDVTMGGSSSGSAISLVENAGAPLPFEPILNFIGFTLADDAAHTRTNISAGPTGTWTVPQGGTGQASLNPNAVLLGEGTSPIGFVNPVSTGFVLTDNGPGHDPSFQRVAALPGGTGIVTVTGGVGGTVAIPLPIVDGGTQRPSLTTHAVLIGEGTSPINFAVATSAGYVLTDNGPGVDPTFQPAPGTSFPNPTSTDTSLTFDPVLFGSAPHLGWVAKRTVFNVRSYGAVGNNAGLDTAAFTAAVSDIVRAGGGTLYVPIPPNGQPYIIGSTGEQTLTVPTHVLAEPGASVKAVNASGLRSFFRLQAQCTVSDLIMLGNNGVSYGVLFNGAAGSVVSGCNFQNIDVNCVRSSAYQSGATITLISDSGGGPAITLTQPYPLALIVSGNVYVKFFVGGALGTAQIQTSSDGITYSTVNQTLFTTTPIGQPFPPQLATDSGLALVTTAGTFTNGRVLHWTVTPPNTASNEKCVVQNCTGNLCGAIYATSGVFSNYSGGPVQSVTGTATWSAANQVVTFSGLTGVLADLTTVGLRDGDAIYLPGAKFKTWTGGTRDTGTIVQVLGPSQLYLDGFDLPTANGTNSDFAIIQGGTAFTDPVTGPYNDYLNLIGGKFLQQANGFRDGALNGGKYATIINAYGFAHYVGTLSSD